MKVQKKNLTQARTREKAATVEKARLLVASQYVLRVVESLGVQRYGMISSCNNSNGSRVAALERDSFQFSSLDVEFDPTVTHTSLPTTQKFGGVHEVYSCV
jgi:hypothetical protein